MKTIFINVKCEMGQSYLVADTALERVEQISEIYSTSGQWDLMIKCYLDDEIDIGRFVTEQIQRLNGVKDTFTIIAYKAFSEDKSH